MTAETGHADFMVGAFLDLGSKVESVRHAVEEMPKPLTEGHRVFAQQPIGSQSPTLIYPTSQNGPAQGYVWNIRAMALTGITDAHTAVTGVTAVEFYCGQEQLLSTTSQPEVGNLVDLIPGAVFNAAPCSVTFPRHVIWAQNGDVPYALVYGGTPGTLVFLLAIVEVWRMCDVWKMSIRGGRYA